ncbi:MAG: DUF3857 domain-containing protein [Deltaproteobacteria bacterium]|nr:DUF3857 domain-containing protein [Deltaproteobacteria bacterium]
MRSGARARLGTAALAALCLVAASGAPVGAREIEPRTTAEAWARSLATLDRGRDPVAVATAIWQALELVPLTTGADAELRARLTRLARSALAFASGEAQLALARLEAMRPGGAAAARDHARAAGVLGEGRVSGPLPGPGDASSTPPDERDPSWRDFGDLTRAGALPLADLLPAVGDAHAFVTFAVEARAPTAALVVAGSNGPLEVWLDGRSLVRWDGERPLSDWQHAVPVELAAGRHTLVARVGHRSAAPELVLRLVDRRGLRPTALGGPAGSPARPGAITPLTALARTPLERARLAVWVTPDATIDHAAAEALAAEGWPTLAARIERADESRARALLEASASTEALGLLLQIASRQGLPADAERFHRRLAEREPSHPIALAHEALTRLELADAAAALPIIDGDPRLPHNARLSAAHATLLERAGRIPEAAAAWARVAVLLDGDADAVQRAVGLWRRTGDDARAVAVVDEALERRPRSIDLHILRARTLAATNPRAGIEALDALVPLHADMAPLHETRGRLLLLAGEQGAAVADFDRALELQPQNRELADYRRALVSERGLAERWARPLPEILDEARATPPAPEGVVAIFERYVIKVFPSGLSSTFRQLAFRIDTDAAAQRMQSFDLDYTPGEDRLEILEAEIARGDQRLRPDQIQDLRQDGKSSGVYTLQAAKVIRFPPLRPGDVMHLQIRSDEIGSRNLFGDFFGAIVPIASNLAKRRSELVIEAPTSRRLFWKTQGVPEPTVAEVDEGEPLQRLTFVATDVPAIFGEPLMPGYGDVGRWVSVSTFSRWEDLARWYRELVRAQLEVPQSLLTIARDLVAPHADDVRAKVAAIHGWVIANTRYVGIEFGIHGYKPYAVAEVVKRGYGDCKDKAALIVAMCQAVGIPAEFVLVRTRDLGALADTPATLRAFNHAIAYIPALDLYLDGTAEVAGLDELPELDQDAQVLRLDLYRDAPPVLARIPMQPPTLNRVTSESRYVIDERGDATATFDELIRGSEAAELRVRLQDPTRRDQLIGGIIASQHPGATLVAVRFDNLDRPGAPVRIVADVRLPALGVVGRDRMEIPVVLEPGLELRMHAPAATRRHPLVLPQLEREEVIDRYALPAGWTIDALPAPVVLESPFARYELAVERDGPDIVVKQSFEQRVHRIAAADYPAYRQMLSEMARAEATRLVLVKRPSAGL